MDKKKLNEVIEQYMMFDKRTLAELLALRGMSKSDKRSFKKVEVETRRYCIGLGDYCKTNECAGCLFNYANQTKQPDGVYVVNPDCTTVSGVSPDFVTTTTN